MKIFRIVGLLIVVSLLAGMVGTAWAADPTVKMAILAPMTGDVSTFGLSMKNGTEMAFEEWNAKGGVNGAQIEWVIGDTRCDPLEARNAANKVVDQDGVKFIIGAACSSASIPIADVANPKKVLQISPASTNPQVTLDKDGNVRPYTFRACFIDPFQGTVGAQFALNTLGARKAAVLKDVGNDYVMGLAEYFEAAFVAGGGEVVASESYTKDDTDFSAILAKIASAQPDVIYHPDYYNKVSLVAKQAKERGLNVPIVGGDGWDSPDLDLEALDGGFFTNHYAPEDPRPEVQAFVAAYKEKFGVGTDAFATLGYDATNILLTAMAEAGSNDPEVVKDAVAAIDFNGVTGNITFDENHNPIKSVAILQIKDGKVSYKETVTPTAGQAEEAAPIVVSDVLKQGVTIAVIAPMTGDVSTFGASTKNGAEMVFEKWNAAGANIRWVVADDRCDPLEARNAANKVIDQDGVKFIVGAVCSSASIPISDIANPKKVLQISSASTNPQVTLDKDGNVKPYTFRACYLDSFQGEVGAQFALNTLGAKKAAVLKDVGNDYVKGLAEFFEAAFVAGGGEVVASESYTKDDADFSAILAKIASVQPDVIYHPDYYNKVNLVAKQAKEKGLTIPMLGADGWDSPDLDLEALDGGFFTNHYAPEDPRPEVQTFVAAYKEKYGVGTDALAVLGYDAANIMVESINNANSADPDVVKEAMAAIDYNGVTGHITYDANHNPIKSVAILQIKDGKMSFKEMVNP